MKKLHFDADLLIMVVNFHIEFVAENEVTNEAISIWLHVFGNCNC